MTDRKQALEALLAKVEAGILDHGHCLTRHTVGIPMNASMWDAYNGSLDAALALHEAVLPGWWYQLGSCHLSDDARVSPDFNCPIHGADLSAKYDPAIDWADMTDVDQRPAGNPARALLIAILRALIAQEAAT